MHPVILLLACAIYHEDRSGDLTAQWAIAHTLLVRLAQQGRYPDTLSEIIAQKNQFPWGGNNVQYLNNCRGRKSTADTVAWELSLERAQLTWNARDTVWHNYSCFFHAGLRGKYPIANNHQHHQFGTHIFWEC